VVVSSGGFAVVNGATRGASCAFEQCCKQGCLLRCDIGAPWTPVRCQRWGVAWSPCLRQPHRKRGYRRFISGHDLASSMTVEQTLSVATRFVAGTAVERHGTRASFRSIDAARHLLGARDDEDL